MEITIKIKIKNKEIELTVDEIKKSHKALTNFVENPFKSVPCPIATSKKTPITDITYNPAVTYNSFLPLIPIMYSHLRSCQNT